MEWKQNHSFQDLPNFQSSFGEISVRNFLSKVLIKILMGTNSANF